MDPLFLARVMREGGVDESKADFIAHLVSEYFRAGGAADLEVLEAKVSWRVLRWNLLFFMPPLLALIGLVGWLLDRASVWCAG